MSFPQPTTSADIVDALVDEAGTLVADPPHAAAPFRHVTATHPGLDHLPRPLLHLTPTRLSTEGFVGGLALRRLEVTLHAHLAGPAPGTATAGGITTFDLVAAIETLLHGADLAASAGALPLDRRAWSWEIGRNQHHRANASVTLALLFVEDLLP